MAEYRNQAFPAKTLDGFGACWSQGTYWDKPGGYVGHADWRDQYGQGTRTYCGRDHAHSAEDAALACIKKRHEVPPVNGTLPQPQTFICPHFPAGAIVAGACEQCGPLTACG